MFGCQVKLTVNCFVPWGPLKASLSSRGIKQLRREIYIQVGTTNTNTFVHSFTQSSNKAVIIPRELLMLNMLCCYTGYKICIHNSYYIFNKRRPNSHWNIPICCLSYTVNSISTKVARASAGMVLTPKEYSIFGIRRDDKQLLRYKLQLHYKVVYMYINTNTYCHSFNSYHFLWIKF